MLKKQKHSDTKYFWKSLVIANFFIRNQKNWIFLSLFKIFCLVAFEKIHFLKNSMKFLIRNKNDFAFLMLDNLQQ